MNNFFDDNLFNDLYNNPNNTSNNTNIDTSNLLPSTGVANSNALTTFNGETTFNNKINLNNNILTNGATITPLELSLLDNASSNIQSQINNLGNIGTLSTNTNAISSNDTINTFASKTNTQLLNTSSNISSINSNINETLNYLQSQITNSNNTNAGSSVIYFFNNNTNSINSSYKTISKTPSNSSTIIMTTGSINNTSGNILMGQFMSNAALNITNLPAGLWSFDFFTNITNNYGNSYIIVEVYKYSSGTSTLLFSVSGNDLNTTLISPYNITTSQNSFTLNLTDYLITKIYGATSSTSNITINVDFNSSQYYSNFTIPLSQINNSHNDLLDKQGGAFGEYYHLSNSQYNNVINPSSTTQNGYLTSTSFNTFNNKENSIIAGTTSQYYRGDKTFQTLDKSTIGLSNVVNKDFSQPINGLIYVNGRSGNNSNDGLSLINAYLTINQALSNTYINSGYQVVIYPATYAENITISQNNLSIVSSNLEIGGLCNINGNITITSNSTSIRLCGLTMNNLVITGSANVYIQNCFINGSLSKSGNGYLSMNNIVFGNSSTFTITGSGNVNILNGCQIPNITINNTTALINISNNLYITKLIINAGIVSVSNTVIYGSSQSGNQFNCCTVNNNSFLYLNNCDLVDAFNNTPYIISVASTAFYSLNNNSINYAGSSLLGTNLNRQLYFDDLFTTGSQVVNLNSVQTLINKTLNNPTLLNNIIKTSTGQNITFENITDTIVNLSSNQTLSNKVLSTPQLINNNFRTAAGRTINFLDVADTVVNLNSIQTLTNKTISLLDGSTAITQASTDNTTKLATTAYVKNLLATISLKPSWTSTLTPSASFIFGPSNIYTLTLSSVGLITIKPSSGAILTINYGYNSTLFFNEGALYESSSGSSLPIAGVEVSNSSAQGLNGRSNIVNFFDSTNLFRINVYYTAVDLAIYYAEQLI